MSKHSFPNSYTAGRLATYRKQTARKPPKYNVCPEIIDYLPAFKQEFDGHTKEMHEHESHWAMKQAARAKDEWNALYTEYSKTHTLSDSPISGIAYGGNFPREIQDRLGDLARMESTLVNAAYAHWIASGHRRSTFRSLRQQHNV